MVLNFAERRVSTDSGTACIEVLTTSMQVMEDDHVADLGQWILESSSAGQSDTALKQFATANTIFPAVSLSPPL